MTLKDLLGSFGEGGAAREFISRNALPAGIGAGVGAGALGLTSYLSPEEMDPELKRKKIINSLLLGSGLGAVTGTALNESGLFDPPKPKGYEGWSNFPAKFLRGASHHPVVTGTGAAAYIAAKDALKNTGGIIPWKNIYTDGTPFSNLNKAFGPGSTVTPAPYGTFGNLNTAGSPNAGISASEFNNQVTKALVGKNITPDMAGVLADQLKVSPAARTSAISNLKPYIENLLRTGYSPAAQANLTAGSAGINQEDIKNLINKLQAAQRTGSYSQVMSAVDSEAAALTDLMHKKYIDEALGHTGNYNPTKGVLGFGERIANRLGHAGAGFKNSKGFLNRIWGGVKGFAQSPHAKDLRQVALDPSVITGPSSGVSYIARPGLSRALRAGTGGALAGGSAYLFDKLLGRAADAYYTPGLVEDVIANRAK